MNLQFSTYTWQNGKLRQKQFFQEVTKTAEKYVTKNIVIRGWLVKGQMCRREEGLHLLCIRA